MFADVLFHFIVYRLLKVLGPVHVDALGVNGALSVAKG